MYSHVKNKPLRHYLNHKAHESLGESDVPSLPAATIDTFPVDKMQAMLKMHDRRSNLYRNHQRYLDYLDKTEGTLSLAKLPNDIMYQLDQLRAAFPNFASTVDYFRQQFALAQLSGFAAFAANPLLIVGPPGVGKTAFCHALAKLVAMHFELISMSGVTAGFVIGGMSSNWADGKPGKVVEALARGHLANPLIVVDEIDKVGGDNRYDPLGALYQLLEKETAWHFIDEGLEVPVNCAHIVWIATANHLDNLPEPILSRFAVVEVVKPTRTEMQDVLASIYRKVREGHGWGTRFSESLPDEVMQTLVDADLEPRILQRALITACGKAVLRYAQLAKQAETILQLMPDDFTFTRENSVINVDELPTTVPENFALLPMKAIIEWSVREVAFKDRHERTQHLIGFCDREDCGRVSASIQVYDRINMSVQTSFGQVYQLAGPPGNNLEALYLWKHWKKMFNAIEDIDVTHQYGVLH